MMVSQPVKKAAQVVAIFMAILGGLYAVFDLPERLGKLLSLAPDAHKWIAILTVAFIGIVFAVLVFWFWILPQIRDEPLDGFGDHAMALRRLADLAMPNFPSRISSNTTMAIGLCIKLRVMDQLVSQLDHYGKTGIPSLATELRRETANNPEGLSRHAQWFAKYKREIQTFRESLNRWIEQIEPLMKTRITADLKTVEDWLLASGDNLTRLSSEDTKQGEELERVREMLAEYAEKLDSFADLFAKKAETIANQISDCSQLVRNLKR